MRNLISIIIDKLSIIKENKKNNFLFCISLTIFTVIILGFQNCARNQFSVINAENDQSSTAISDSYSIVERIISLPPFVSTPDIIHEVKVILVVDNSTSMEARQSNLANGLEKLIEKLKGYNLKFYVYTTNSIGPINERLNNYTTENPSFIRATKFQYKDSNGRDVTSPSFLPTANEYTYTVDYALKDSLLSTNNFLRSDFTDAQFESVKSELTNLVTSIGTGGSNDESGLCTIGRILFNPEGKIVKQNDKVAFLLISDEDDHSINSCYNQFVEKKFYDPTSYTSLSPNNYTSVSVPRVEVAKVQYALQRYTISATYNKCKIVNDIEICEPTNDTIDLSVSKRNSIISAVDTLQKCKDAFAERKSISTADISVCTINSSRSYYVGYTDTTNASQKNLCRDDDARGVFGGKTLFEYINEKYPDTYLNSGCEGVTYSRGGIKTEIITNFVRTNPAAASDLSDSIIEKAKSLFGNNGFLISAIIHDEALENSAHTSCVRSDSASDGLAYKTLISKVPNTFGSVTDICLSDYSLALDGIKKFIERQQNFDLSLNLLPEESVTAIKITRGVIELPSLTANVDFEFNQSLQPTPSTWISIPAAQLQDGDRINVVVQRLVKK